MNRFIIVNREVYSGIFYSLASAEQSIASLRETWQGLTWEIVKSDSGFPVPGLIHLGEVRAPRILNRYAKEQASA